MATYVSVEDALASVSGNGTRPSRVTTSNLFRGNDFGDGRLLHSDTPLADVAVAQIDGQAATKTWLRVRAALVAIAIVGGVCWWLSSTMLDKTLPTGPTAPVDGLTIFAVFFLAALGIERFLEPLSTALLPKAAKVADADSALKTAGNASLKFAAEVRDYEDVQQLLASNAMLKSDPTALSAELELVAPSSPAAAAAIADAVLDLADKRPADALTRLADLPGPSPPDNAMTNAATKAELASVRELERTVAFWALATCLGMLVAATMKLYLLHTVGITAGQPWQEMLATGLIIGAGTKPLHDLVQWMSQKAKP